MSDDLTITSTTDIYKYILKDEKISEIYNMNKYNSTRQAKILIYDKDFLNICITDIHNSFFLRIEVYPRENEIIYTMNDKYDPYVYEYSSKCNINEFTEILLFIHSSYFSTKENCTKISDERLIGDKIESISINSSILDIILNKDKNKIRYILQEEDTYEIYILESKYSKEEFDEKILFIIETHFHTKKWNRDIHNRKEFDEKILFIQSMYFSKFANIYWFQNKFCEYMHQYFNPIFKK